MPAATPISCLSVFTSMPTSTCYNYTLSLHDALPISFDIPVVGRVTDAVERIDNGDTVIVDGDRKSTRLNSSHLGTSYAVICWNKERNQQDANTQDLSREAIAEMKAQEYAGDLDHLGF